ncbi:MAG: hypothetical protein AB8G86_03595 [Saprospiraceae bacterium]
MSRYFLFLCVLLFACGEPMTEAQKLEDAKWEAVMSNHDVVMPMMGTTNKVRKKLKKVLKAKDSLAGETVTKINGLIENLDKADEGMMDWMNGFQQLKKLQSEKSHSEILTYLEAQDGVIKQVGVDMTNSIKAGMDFVEEME